MGAVSGGGVAADAGFGFSLIHPPGVNPTETATGAAADDWIYPHWYASNAPLRRATSAGRGEQQVARVASVPVGDFQVQRTCDGIFSRPTADGQWSPLLHTRGLIHVVHTAGLSPAQASPAAIIAVDLVGVAHVLEEFSRVIAFGGSGVVIASQAGHMLPLQPPQQTKCRRPPRWLGNTPAASTAACSPAAPATR